MALPFDLARFLETQLREAAKVCAFDESFVPGVRPTEPRFGDYQANGILPYAKQAKANPRQLATQLVEALETIAGYPQDAIAVEIAGPGFLNFKLSPALLHEWLKTFSDEDRLKSGAGSLLEGQTVVVDFPSPNTAKQMHIGHLRPMVIGEAVKRLLAFAGANVIHDDHLGDWGTNFGTLIMAIKREQFALTTVEPAKALKELERLYKTGTALEKEAPALRDVSRAELVKLQNGDEENTVLWQQIVAISAKAFHQVYAQLGIEPDHTYGESFYRDKVERIYKELSNCGLATESEGALVVFHPEHPRFAEQPFIIRKADGASNYASTDLATVLFRVETLDAERIVYFTDGRQQDHFQQLFLTTQKWFEKMGYTLPSLEHVWWGSILGEDGKAIKTRSGEPILLRQLLDDAQARAYAIVAEKNPDLTEELKRAVARSVGIGAVRYADLNQNRTQDYTFAWDRMLAFDGNTAPYLLYAGARIHSIFRKAGYKNPAGTILNEELINVASPPETETELALARKLVAFPTALELTLGELRPHFLCTYLYELTGLFSSFYNADRVMVEAPDVKARRLLLCARTLLVLETGLRLLGLEPVEQM